MTHQSTQHRALLLAAMMVISVFAMSIAFTGAVAADNRFETGSDNVTDDAILFQGEAFTELQFTNDSGINLTSVEALTTDDGNVPLVLESGKIPTDQQTGVYTGDDAGGDPVSVILRTPRVTDLDVLNANDEDVAGGTLLNDEAASVKAEYNFGFAENISVTVEDANGVDVTSEWFTNTSVDGSEDPSFTDVTVVDNTSVEWDLSASTLGALDVGTYTIIVEGDENLDFGDATRTTTLSLIDDEKASITLSETDVTVGSDVSYTVTGVSEGDVVTVGVETSDADDASASTDVFRNVGDVTNSTADTITVDGDTYYIAELTIDGADATGLIETADLDSATIDVAVWHNNSTNLDTTTESTDDTAALTVSDASVTLDSPTGSYVIGSAVDISGSTTANVDSVRLYVRAGSSWEPLYVDGSTQNISVDADDTFSESDVRISTIDQDGNNLISIPGSYRIGVIDAEEAAAVEETGGEITTANFNDQTSTTYSIVTTTGSLDVSFTTYNGQVDTSNLELDVDGVDMQSAGDKVLAVLVDSRGNNQTEALTVEDDGTIDATIDVDTNFNEGTVGAHIISAGRDGTIGDTGLTVDGYNGAEFNADVRNQGTQSQVTADILSATVDATGSDDQIASLTFRLADPTVSITEVTNPVAQGDTLTVSGQTNGNPDTDIIVEIFDGDGNSEFITSTDDWGTDGSWSVTFETAELPLGSYSVEADYDGTTDVSDLAVVDEVSTPEPEPEPEPTPEPTEEPEEETPAETPGFGLLVALTALVAAGFLALRRLD